MSGVVYFVGKPGRVKIGTTTRLLRRMNQIAKLAGPVELIGTVPGGRVLERRLHQECAQWRIESEWFTDCPELRAIIQSYLTKLPELKEVEREKAWLSYERRILSEMQADYAEIESLCFSRGIGNTEALAYLTEKY
jgi:hypothetical protein